MGLIPTIGEFAAESETQVEAGVQLDGVSGKEGAFERPPSERRVRWGVCVGAYGSGEERGQICEGKLAVLVLSERVVALQPLDPDAGAQKMFPVSERDLIGAGKNIASRL